MRITGAVSINTPRARSLLYGLVGLASVVVFGNIAEICDSADQCPGRLIGVIVFGVLATILSLTMFAATIMASRCLGVIEFFVSFSLLVIHSVCAGLVSSVRTGLGNVIAVSFSWLCLVISFVLMFASVTAEGGLLDRCFTEGFPKARDLENAEIRGRDSEILENVQSDERWYMERRDDTGMDGPKGEGRNGSNQSETEPSQTKPQANSGNAPKNKGATKNTNGKETTGEPSSSLSNPGDQSEVEATKAKVAPTDV